MGSASEEGLYVRLIDFVPLNSRRGSDKEGEEVTDGQPSGQTQTFLSTFSWTPQPESGLDFLYVPDLLDSSYWGEDVAAHGWYLARAR